MDKKYSQENQKRKHGNQIYIFPKNIASRKSSIAFMTIHSLGSLFESHGKSGNFTDPKLQVRVFAKKTKGPFCFAWAIILLSEIQNYISDISILNVNTAIKKQPFGSATSCPWTVQSRWKSLFHEFLLFSRRPCQVKVIIQSSVALCRTVQSWL